MKHSVMNGASLAEYTCRLVLLSDKPFSCHVYHPFRESKLVSQVCRLQRLHHNLHCCSSEPRICKLQCSWFLLKEELVNTLNRTDCTKQSRVTWSHKKQLHVTASITCLPTSAQSLQVAEFLYRSRKQGTGPLNASVHYSLVVGLWCLPANLRLHKPRISFIIDISLLTHHVLGFKLHLNCSHEPSG